MAEFYSSLWSNGAPSFRSTVFPLVDHLLMDTYTDFYNFATINSLTINMGDQEIHVDFDSFGHIYLV